MSARHAMAAALCAIGLVLFGCQPKASVTEEHAHEDEHGHAHDEEHPHVELVPEAIRRGGIVAEVAGARDIEVLVEMPGEVKLNAERVAQVRPRFAGVVRSLHRGLGDTVGEGDLLAVVQSNESLSDYEIRSPRSGRVIDRSATSGQTVDHESVLFTIADLSSVWVDFALYPQVAGRVRPGQSVRIVDGTDSKRSAIGTVHYVGPLLEQDTRVSYGRVVLANRKAEWTPGLFVTAVITVERVKARVAVPEEAIVRTADGPAVFRADSTHFDLVLVVPGRSDGTWTELAQGIEPGERVVVKNAFLLKAELGKSEAAHDH